MLYIIPKKLKEDYKILNKPVIWWKDVKTSSVLLGLALVTKNFVHSWLLVPFWITVILTGYYLIQPAESNPKKRKWEAILFLINKDHITYHSLNHVQEQEETPC